MKSSLKTKREIVVFGGTGSIGGAISKKLFESGRDVTVVSRNKRYPLLETVKSCGLAPGPTIRYLKANVTHEDHVKAVARSLTNVGAIIYAVGHCPPAGFEAQIQCPLTEIFRELQQEFEQHVIGLHNVVVNIAREIRRCGCLVVIGSAITRLTDENCPDWLYAGQYATAKAAQHEYVRWLRRDPMIRNRNIRIHYLAPRAVNTPFHDHCSPDHEPPVKLPISEVVDEVLAAIDSGVHVDKIV